MGREEIGICYRTVLNATKEIFEVLLESREREI